MTFHDNLDKVAKDVQNYTDSDNQYAGSPTTYTNEWIARLQTQNQGQRCQIKTLEKLVSDIKNTDRLKTVITDMAKDMGKQDLNISELKRKLDAANSLLHEKDVIIAELRKRNDSAHDALHGM